MRLHFRKLSQPKREFSGMSSLELLLAIAMLAVFTGVVVMVMQFTLRFFGTAESGAQNNLGFSNGVLIDHAQLHIAMDTLVEVLSQPGVSLSGSAFTQTANPSVACTDNPRSAWGLQGLMDVDEVRFLLPPGYRLCLLKTTVLETASTPGIYLLQALPEQKSAFALPARRLFCRPRPFC